MQAWFSYFIAPPDNNLLYLGIYDPVLVTLSCVVAFLASYAALQVAQHARGAATTKVRRAWIAVGGFCLGLGIWAMHFVGMLAFNLPCTTGYNTALTLLSMLPGIAACTLAMALISRPALSRAGLWLGGLLLGTGIGAMHYTGMAALRLDGLVRYDLRLFLLSLAVAAGLAMLALWSRFRLQKLRGRWWRWATPISAAIIGLAVSGMHYTAMAATYFLRDGDSATIDSQIGPAFLAALVLAATGVIIFMTLAASYMARPNLLSATHSYRMIGLLVAGWSLLAWLGVGYYYNQVIASLYETEWNDANQKIESLVRNIDETLRGIKGIPQVFSDSPTVHRALRRFGSATPLQQPLVERRRKWTAAPELGPLNQELRNIATHLPIDVVWVMNAAGDSIAASNFDQVDSFIGGNFSVRQYFRMARAGQRGQQYGVGLLSKIPGVFYSYPVQESGRFAGVITVKRNISNFANWIESSDAFLTDANGVIVMAADKRLEFRTLPGAHARSMSVEQLRAWYVETRLRPLSVEPWGDPLLPAAVRVGASSVPSLFLSSPLPDGMMTVHITRPLTEVARLQSQKIWLFVLLTISGGLLILTGSALVLYLRESRKTEADLRIAATAFESQEGMIITDARQVILRINQAFTRMTGYTAQDAVGKTPRLLRSERQSPAFYQAMWETIERTGSWQGEVWNRGKNGTIYPSWLTITAVHDDQGQVTHYVGMHTDITQRKAAEEEIANLAYYDSLTQLPNRRLLLDRLHQALAASLRKGSRGALLFIDLDNFKTLNDTLGHDKGDLLLREVARRLTTCLRDGDTVARLGGDEFVVMLEGLASQQEEAAAEARTVGEKIIGVLNRPYALADYSTHSTPSIGVALFGSGDDTTDEILKRADLAMYQAKAAGRNTLRFFDPDMQASVNARAAMEADLREALLRRQLLLHYQVQVNANGQVVGAEALVRWMHPRNGMISPAVFIPLAEETGQIQAVGQWVLETACMQLVEWSRRPETAHLRVAVNVSARQFHHPEFIHQVVSVLARTGVNPRRLKLELTESLLLADVEDTISKMEQLKAHGIDFSLDDFGTGYSSLADLKRLPLAELKIDRSFVRDVFTDANDASIVKTVIALAHSMGLGVIAEGVETEAQRSFLLMQGCNVYQGYLFGQPTTADRLQFSVSTTGA